jgi:hypothetical protein
MATKLIKNQIIDGIAVRYESHDGTLYAVAHCPFDGCDFSEEVMRAILDPGPRAVGKIQTHILVTHSKQVGIAEA